MHDRQKIIDTLRPFAHRSNVERIEEAVQALRPFGDGAVAALADVSSDSDDYIRLMALEVLGEWDGDTMAALPAMISALDDPDRIVRIAAVGPVARHSAKAKAAVPSLLKWLDTGDEHSRLTAAALILKIDPSQHDEMLTILAEGMESDGTGIRCLTAWLLSGLRDVTLDAHPLLQQMLGDENEYVRSVVEEEIGSGC